MELIYILTYNCNLRCTYCDIDKRKEDMEKQVFLDTFSFVKNFPYDIHKVKFFGGEPLLQKKYIQEIVTSFPKNSKPNFYVTSNATLIDPIFLTFAQKNSLFVTFSIDGDKETTNENRKVFTGKNLYEIIEKNTKKYAEHIRINQVITRHTAKNFFKNFKYLYDMGIRNFNFLPEYFRLWDGQGLIDLKKGFDEIFAFYREGNNFYVVNEENYSETTFFNIGIVIDTDGRLYGTNLILAGIFEKYKDILTIGNISTGISENIYTDEVKRNIYIQLIHDLELKEYGSKVMKSVHYVDVILDYFLDRYTKYKFKTKIIS